MYKEICIWYFKAVNTCEDKKGGKLANFRMFPVNNRSMWARMINVFIAFSHVEIKSWILGK